MLYHVSEINSISQLKFDDEIIGEFIKVTYTHHEDGKPMFLLSRKKGDKWICNNTYAIGLTFALEVIKATDIQKSYSIEYVNELKNKENNKHD